jgi:hypothetical protein
MDFETYSQSKRADYAALAETVASILQAALKAYPGVFRLQQMQHRAKENDSLKKKLEDRGIQSTATLEADIKDLAGCRLIDELVAEVNEGNADEWFAICQRCAQTDSSDAATFPSFGLFLQKLGRAKPLIVLRFFEKLDERLAGFLGIMLSGLAESDSHAEVAAKIVQWVSEDRYLNQIAHYFRFAPQFDNAVLSKILDAGIRLKSDEIVGQVLATVFSRYKDGTPGLIDGIIMPGIAYFTERQDARWVKYLDLPLRSFACRLCGVICRSSTRG